MVPVPEDLADKVLMYVSWKGRPGFADAVQHADDAQGSSSEAKDGSTSDGGPIARVFVSLDEASRALLEAAAIAAMDQDPLTVAGAARRVGLSAREVVGAVMEINQAIADEGGPPISVFLRRLEDANVGEVWDNQVVDMREPVALELAKAAGVVLQR